MLYPLMYGYPESVSGPIRTGLLYGSRVLVASASDLYFLFVDPRYAWLGPCRDSGSIGRGWPLPHKFPRSWPYWRPQGSPHAARSRGAPQVAAGSRRRPGSDGGRRHGGDHTVCDDRFAGDVTVIARDHASEAAPKVVSYVNEDAEIRQEREDRGASPDKGQRPPTAANPKSVEATLQPPTLRDLGRSIANLVYVPSSELWAGWSGRSAPSCALGR